MKVLYVRHIESVANAQGTMAGHRDVPASEFGTLQLKDIYKKLKREKIDFIYSSDLIRAKYTADSIHKAHPAAALVITPQLRGRNYGNLEGKAVHAEERESFYQKIYKIDFDYPGIEPVKQFYERNLKFLLELLKKHKDESIAIVAHASNGRVITAIANGINVERIGSDVKMPLPGEVRIFNFREIASSSN